MADRSKAERLIAAKKRFKELQKQKQQDKPQETAVDNNVDDIHDNRNHVDNSVLNMPTELNTNIPDNNVYKPKKPTMQSYFGNYSNAFMTVPTSSSFYDAAIPQLDNFQDSSSFYDSFAQSYNEDYAEKYVADTSETERCENNSDNVTKVNKYDVEKPYVEPVVNTVNLSTNPFVDNRQQEVEISSKDRIDELENMLEIERFKNNKLILENTTIISESDQLRIQLKQLQMDAENASKVTQELLPLQEQLQIHVKTVGILVGEKTELTTSLNKSESELKAKNSECEELQGRLKASRYKANELERELNNLKKYNLEFDKTRNDIVQQLESARKELQQSQIKLEETVEESSEIKQKLKAKVGECEKLREELKENVSQLSISELKLQQLSTDETNEQGSQYEKLNNDKKILESIVQKLEASLNKVANEKDQVSQQYQQYVQQLNSQLQTLASKVQELTNENEALSEREKNLTEHVNELEKQLQNGAAVKRKDTPPIVLNDKELLEVKEKYENLELKFEELKTQLEKKNSCNDLLEQELLSTKHQIKDLEETVETLRNEKPDSVKLNALIESDKLAAARATAQNKDLKMQLEELQKGFVKMSDYKLEITEKLNAEQHLGRELNNQVTKLTEELDKLKSVLNAKDEEMIRLQHESVELNKQILQQSQLSDRLRHYEAKEKASILLENEVQSLREQIANVEARNIQLETKNSNGIATESETIVEKVEQPLIERSISSTDVEIPNDEAMEKLKDKFLKLMSDIADLSDEKQKLEHLVLQLQGETETIGEYITLYQVQRGMLKQREMEKDSQLQRLSVDREEMKHKLIQLNNLVQHLLQERDSNVLETYSSEFDKKEIKNSGDVVEIPEDAAVPSGDTAEKIIALLDEIKTSNLVHPKQEEGVSGVHHCHCCSGKLITI